MSELPRLAISLLTYNRTELSVRTIESTSRNLIYPKELIGWYVCDDGSPTESFDTVIQTLVFCDQKIIGSHRQRIRPDGSENTFFCGKSWNLALGICHQWSDFVLTLENDWELEKPLDITRYMETIRDHEDIGLLRLGVLAVGNKLEIVGYDGVHYLKYLRGEPYCYSGNPNIRHARFTRAYGMFAEDKNPGEIELDLDYRFQRIPGPDIIRPAEINPWGAWGHIGSSKSYA